MEGDDPMAFLNAKRKEMAAMAEMAAVAQMQCDLARDVALRMEKIDSLLEGESSSSVPNGMGDSDPEVNFWRKKVDELSEPIGGSNNTSCSQRADSSHAKLSWKGTSSFNDDHNLPSSSTPVAQQRMGDPTQDPPFRPRIPKSTPLFAQPKSLPIPPLPDLAPSARLDLPQNHVASERLCPMSTIPSCGDNDLDDKGDPEVEYWRRKIAELSAVNPTGGATPAPGKLSIDADGGYHSTRLPSRLSPSFPRSAGQPMPQRLNLTNPRYKSRSLADEPLSWEGTASYADENKEPSGCSARGTGKKTAAKAEEKCAFSPDDDEDILLAANHHMGLRCAENK